LREELIHHEFESVARILGHINAASQAAGLQLFNRLIVCWHHVTEMPEYS
jgi:hypothetical protein